VSKVKADRNAPLLREGNGAPKLILSVGPAKHDVLPDLDSEETSLRAAQDIRLKDVPDSGKPGDWAEHTTLAPK